VDEERHGRLHLGVRREVEDTPALGRALDQDDVRLEVGEHGPQAPRGARAVMADAEQADGHASSRQAR
jgi:hypothetical protein